MSQNYVCVFPAYGLVQPSSIPKRIQQASPVPYLLPPSKDVRWCRRHLQLFVFQCDFRYWQDIGSLASILSSFPWSNVAGMQLCVESFCYIVISSKFCVISSCLSISACIVYLLMVSLLSVEVILTTICRISAFTAMYMHQCILFSSAHRFYRSCNLFRFSVVYNFMFLCLGIIFFFLLEIFLFALYILILPQLLLVQCVPMMVAIQPVHTYLLLLVQKEEYVLTVILNTCDLPFIWQVFRSFVLSLLKFSLSQHLTTLGSLLRILLSTYTSEKIPGLSVRMKAISFVVVPSVLFHVRFLSYSLQKRLFYTTWCFISAKTKRYLKYYYSVFTKCKI